jgi:hypothetical protein
LLLTQRVDHTYQVSNQLEQTVGFLARGAVAPTETTQVWRSSSITCLCQRRQLVTPCMRSLRKSVAKQNERAFALFNHVKIQALGPHSMVSRH